MNVLTEFPRTVLDALFRDREVVYVEAKPVDIGHPGDCECGLEMVAFQISRFHKEPPTPTNAKGGEA